MRPAIFLALLIAIPVRVCASTPGSDRVSLAGFDQLISEIERLDGQALQIRQNRTLTWNDTVRSLRNELASADSTDQLARLFRRLDLAYPSRHADHKFAASESAGLVPKIRFTSEWRALDAVHLRISNIDDDTKFPPSERPQVGDEITAIDGRTVSAWFTEGFAYCKFPLKSQCAAEFADEFQMQRYSWTQAQPLTYTITRGTRNWTIAVPLREPKGSVSVDRGHGCKSEADRYRGFRLQLAGNRACAYFSTAHPSIAILRISSFRYDGTDEIATVQKEVNNLRPWLARQGQLSNLIIDLTDNGGGDSPAPYFRLLTDQPFQGPAVIRFKKIKELESNQLRAKLLWNSAEAEAWFQELKNSGEWSKLQWGEYLPPLPQFCTEGSALCQGNLLKPFPEAYTGKVTLLVNRMCMSACDHFTYLAKSLLKGRVVFVGEPTTADTGYGRLTVHLLKQPFNGAWTAVTSQGEQPPSPEWNSQSVVVSKTVDREGRLLDGHPITIDRFVPTTLENRKDWLQSAIRSALQ